MRRWLVITSLTVHLAVVIGLFITGGIERLDRPKLAVSIALGPPPPAPSSSPADAPTPKFTHKARAVVHMAVQPTRRDPEPVVAAAGSGDGSGNGSGSGSGSGSGDDPGPCTVDCGEPGPVAVVDKPAAPPGLVAPAVIRGLRISGETQIQPPDPVKTAIRRDGHTRIVASFKVCVATTGEVAAVTMAKSSGYPAYDTILVERLGAWRYRPYAIGGRAVPVCGMVTFVYSME